MASNTPCWFSDAGIFQHFEMFRAEWSERIIHAKRRKNPDWDAKFNLEWLTKMIHDEIDELKMPAKVSRLVRNVDVVIDAMIYTLDSLARHVSVTGMKLASMVEIETHIDVADEEMLAANMRDRWHYVDGPQSAVQFVAFLQAVLYRLVQNEFNGRRYLDEMFDAVHRANLTKLDGPVVAVEGDPNKVGKPADFVDPEVRLAEIISQFVELTPVVTPDVETPNEDAE